MKNNLSLLHIIFFSFIFLVTVTTVGVAAPQSTISSLSVEEQEENWVYTTRPGDTLWNLSKEYLGYSNGWHKLKKYNKIVNHKIMPPGTRLKFPVSWLKKKPSPALVESVIGITSFTTRDINIPKPLLAGSRLSFGTRVSTGKNGTVTLRFADDSRLYIQKNSVVHLNALGAHGENGMVDTRLQLQKGRVESDVIPFKNNKSRYEITTPAAVASVRGTQFRVSMNPESETMFSEVIGGTVAVASEGVTQIVPAGFGTKAIKGRPPEPARQLLNAPDLSKLPKQMHTRPVYFKWSSLKDAAEYRVQIARSLKFKEIFYDTTTTKAELKWHKGKRGQYALRVRAIDNSGLEGKDSSHLFSIENEIPSPELSFPRNKSELAKGIVAFQWRAHSDASRFLLQVSEKSDFSKNVIEVSGSQMHYSSRKPLNDGIYYWRVANEYAAGINSQFSETSSFIINTKMEE